ncbi:DUF6401 family natural product biosynthesis protein [Lipingzhangella sp. LS1_29]|uniref:DUF6401 family natural product biosynthesis protein n=1 Tax=Lipingzhangella rawalii TaxID=2055835 RepID=A0ABU2H372_9ACTN|nr:DUF6401 family natural product biosynthesis protein [Lipingzhangella rawalii]MDS1269751.1 DUF6401 family natural product biosynthesis protein [Lipingzhangella rawalii]
MLRGFFTECPLTQLSRDLDAFGMLSTSVHPGLLAQIDQHTAAIRDSISQDGVPVTRTSLAHYLRGFLDGARERGWDSTGDSYDWETLRLMSICSLARDLGFVR